MNVPVTRLLDGARELPGASPSAAQVSLEGDLAEEGWPEWFPRRDAELALQIDRFDFALPVRREAGLCVARPVW